MLRVFACSDEIHVFRLDLFGKRRKKTTPRAAPVDQIVRPPAHFAFAPRGGRRPVQPPEIVGAVPVHFVAGDGGGNAAEHGLVGRVLRRRVGQVVPAAFCPAVREKERNAELPGKPCVEPLVPRAQRRLDALGVGQEDVAVSAAAVEQIRPAHAAGEKKLVRIVLHEQLQKERPAAERAECLVGSHGVQKFLYAGNIRRIQQKSVFLPKSGLFQKEPLFIISLSGAQQILADAHADGRRGPTHLRAAAQPASGAELPRRPDTVQR